MKTTYAAAALSMLLTGCLVRAMADEVSGPSVSSCAVGEPSTMVGLSPGEVTTRDALFMKLCIESNGALLNGSRSVPDLTLPGKFVGHGPQDFYPPDLQLRNLGGTIYVAFVVELDGRTSSATVIKSAGIPEFDVAALKFIYSISFKSPAYLNSIPVRFFAIQRVSFRIG